MDLKDGSVEVGIGYLGGEAHRQAFAAIFAKMIGDNIALLRDCRLTRIGAKRAIRDAPPLPIAVDDLSVSPTQLALALYDSRNERVQLEFTGADRTLEIGVQFDDPYFWLE